jgi:hypothetical protein
MDEKRACRVSLGMVMFGNKGAFFAILQTKKISLGEKPALLCSVLCVCLFSKNSQLLPKYLFF